MGLGGAKSATAAFPSMAEYDKGSGTVVREVESKEKTETLAIDVTPTDAAQLRECMAATGASLAGLRALVDKKAWDNVRQALQTSTPTQKFVKPNRPAVVMKPLSSPCSLDAAALKSFNKYRKECAQSLQELSDFAYTNRVIFFNEEDKKSVSRLEGNLEVDLDEAREYLDNALASFDKMKGIVNTLGK